MEARGRGRAVAWGLKGLKHKCCVCRAASPPTPSVQPVKVHIRRTIPPPPPPPPPPLPRAPRAAQWSAARCCAARISASTWGLRRRGDTGALVTGDAAEGGELEGE